MSNAKKFGTAPVFFTAISTILGAILFLRFGFAVGTLGFWGVILIILLGHLVTIPTALAISELATNKRVQGGGEYFIISRSFGLNIGSTIGITLFLSQAISVAFYVIAFTESFEFLFNWVASRFDFELPRQVISIPVMAILAVLILKKGATLGVKMLYFVVAILFISLTFFFLGKTGYVPDSGTGLSNLEFRNSGDFFMVFAIVFPAFTGMTAGVGLSGDLKKPSRSIPLGTTLATLSGMIVYFFVVYKLAISASPEDMVENQLVMANIAIAGVAIIPLGLAASTASSAIGSILVAPRTLQALARDYSFPSRKLNIWLSRDKNGDPANATWVTAVIAFAFVIMGDVNAVAEIISMFFMVTYGAICLISFLNHFGASPSYRPSFRSKWYLSMIGFVVAVWVMFKINSAYALSAFVVMIVLYQYITHKNKDRKGFQAIFANTLFQLNRQLHVYVQKQQKNTSSQEWRPSALSISQDTFERFDLVKLLNWISYKYGFGTYLHLIQGYYSKTTHQQAEEEIQKIKNLFADIENHVFIDSLISPSYTSAIAQAIQLPGISGMENNMVILDFDKDSGKNLNNVIDNLALIRSGCFDVCILASTNRPFVPGKGIHVWIRSGDYDNANLMILMSFIILGHPDWRKSSINIFNICDEKDIDSTKEALEKMVVEGRLPIHAKNINIIPRRDDVSSKTIINEHSANAALTIIGFRHETLKNKKSDLFMGYDELGTVLFVNSHDQKEIS
ncbi:MAG: amino acid permease [Prolixibacteraceae bacterium]|nr:amino acid permease [Prolixibacteraceae bacterium]MBN2650280.1 amino acid permease [Prolixibacteraceae bacterium]